MITQNKNNHSNFLKGRDHLPIIKNTLNLTPNDLDQLYVITAKGHNAIVKPFAEPTFNISKPQKIGQKLKALLTGQDAATLNVTIKTYNPNIEREVSPEDMDGLLILGRNEAIDIAYEMSEQFRYQAKKMIGDFITQEPVVITFEAVPAKEKLKHHFDALISWIK